jgi:hypothetical protein
MKRTLPVLIIGLCTFSFCMMFLYCEKNGQNGGAVATVNKCGSSSEKIIVENIVKGSMDQLKSQWSFAMIPPKEKEICL